MYKRAVILAGGKGTRLKPYTIAFPKPLVPVGEKPVLEIIIEKLRNSGFQHVTLAIGHLSDIIKAFFGDGSKWGIEIDYSLEKVPLSTMGPLKLIRDLPDNFLVMNGDVLTDLDFSMLYDIHLKAKSIFTIATVKRIETIDYGVLKFDEIFTLKDFKEKPNHEYDVSMGIYVVNKSILDYIPDGEYFGFDNLMLTLLRAKEAVKVVTHHGFWLDIGRPDDYEQACKDIDKLNVNSDMV